MPAWSLHVSVSLKPVQVGHEPWYDGTCRTEPTTRKGDHPRENPHGDEGSFEQIGIRTLAVARRVGLRT